MFFLAAALFLLASVVTVCVTGEKIKREQALKRVTTTSPRLPRPVRRMPVQHHTPVRRHVDINGPTEIVRMSGELSSSEPSWRRKHSQTRLMTSID